MPFVVGIDGTGGGATPTAARDKRYDEDFKNSFVTRICTRATFSKYFRGPVTFGGGLLEAINNGVNEIVRIRQSQKEMPILLTGYSRGAAGAVVIAKRLKDLDIKVKAIMLFDCVDRHIAIDASVIPENVENCYHVIRNPSSKSRESFGNDGLKYYPQHTNYPNAVQFLCTHGGMGGTPWKRKFGENPSDFIDEGFPDGKTKITYQQDEQVSAEVWQHVQPYLRQHGFLN